MPFPLIPFIAGAATGAAATWFFTRKPTDQEKTADETLPDHAQIEAQKTDANEGSSATDDPAAND